MIFNRRIISKRLDFPDLQSHNDNYADIQTDLTDHEGRITGAQSDITTHKASTAAHPAEHVTYDGAVVGATNIKEGLDGLKDTLDNVIVDGGDGTQAAAAAVSVSGTTYDTLKDRVDTEYLQTAAQLAVTAEQISDNSAQIVTVKDIVAIKSDIFMEGDSLSVGDPTAGGSIPKWLSYFLKKPIENRGVWGSWSAQVLARIQTNVIDLRPRQCIILVGTNDLHGSEPLGNIVYNVTQIADKLLDAKIEPIFLAVPPRNDFPADNTKIREYNMRLMVMCQEKMIRFIDTYNPLAKEDGTSLDYIHVADNLHLSVYGAYLIAREVEKYFPSPSIYQNADYPYNYAKGEYPTKDNCAFTLDSNADGLADYWSKVENTGSTYTLEDNPKGGKYQVVRKTSTTLQSAGIYGDVGSLVQNTVYRIEFDLEFDIDNKDDADVTVVIGFTHYDSVGTPIGSNDALNIYAKKIPACTVFKDFTPPVGTVNSRLLMFSRGASSLTIKFGRVYIYKSK
ncbi:hypothetical protein A3844_01630 [Paenibacillus helianthi]|uniref:SGNH hydrolase-type esterase domain-containing protein n=1 Tax=Paenibacillus helianthi TaxID=1349432 RepID=A0ABX3EYC7_9BACL|nr:GDSL-type esterase/lipase family protein [Paenibacillus helianthi]OKP91840.1 hypothetical protein A3844_01630 [Paenibacillus helianthi]